MVELLEDEPSIDVVAAAGDGTETIARCVVYRPDVLVVDVNMPHGGGELAVQVLSVQLPAMRIIALSANSDRVTRRRMVDAGAHVFVPKGDLDQLPERVTEVCERRRGVTPDRTSRRQRRLPRQSPDDRSAAGRTEYRTRSGRRCGSIRWQ